MRGEYPFYSFFILFCLMITSTRSYYCGYVDALSDKVSRLEEGLTLRRIRYILGTIYLAGSVVYLFNPKWMSWGQVEISSAFRWVGVLFLLLSLFFYRSIHVHLGKNFTDTVYVRKEALLIDKGPYRWVRHPMYVCGVLMVVGAALTTANFFLGALGLFLMLVIMIWRTPIEERKLLERFGVQYEEYKEKTGKFIPKF